MEIRKRMAVAAVSAAVLVGGGCERRQPQAAEGDATSAAAPAAEAPRVELGAAGQLDSGNAAYRTKDYQGALGHYRRAAERDPKLAAAWFGMYMAQTSLGDKAGADSSMKKVQELAPGMIDAHRGGPGGGAAPEGAAPAGSLPPGHPALPGKSR